MYSSALSSKVALVRPHNARPRPAVSCAAEKRIAGNMWGGPLGSGPPQPGDGQETAIYMMPSGEDGTGPPRVVIVKRPAEDGAGGSADGVKAPWDDKSTDCPLIVAAEAGLTDAVRLLLSRGADPAAVRARDGGTALHVAAAGGHASTVAALLEHGLPRGMSVDAPRGGPRGDRAPALLLAAAGGHARCVAMLLEAGAAPDGARPSDGATPLAVTALNGDEDIARALLDAGADLELIVRDGSAPLHLAATEGHLGMVHLLLRSGAQVDPRNGDGGTPLFMTAQEGLPEVANVLCEAGADVHEATDAGVTPLVMAGAQVRPGNRFDKVADVLREWGAVV